LVALPNDASGPAGFAMSIGPRTSFETALAHSTRLGLLAAMAAEPGCPAGGANGPAQAVVETHVTTSQNVPAHGLSRRSPMQRNGVTTVAACPLSAGASNKAHRSRP